MPPEDFLCISHFSQPTRRKLLCFFTAAVIWFFLGTHPHLDNDVPIADSCLMNCRNSRSEGYRLNGGGGEREPCQAQNSHGPDDVTDSLVHGSLSHQCCDKGQASPSKIRR